MFEFDYSLIDWSRGQFALTAMYHWLFVPLTLGITFIIAIMETIYVRTGNPEWKKITKFWMTLFGINFAIGVATGIILEFEFGTNWSNYSWFVGDIFGAPLAIEGIMAFFLETTFIAVMFFGWNRVSKRFHLTSTWLVAIGANLSALWILVANAWMQDPVGMRFNPETARNEMVNFWDVFLSPMAINKFLHTITSAYTLSAVFVIGISAWFLLRGRHQMVAKKSMIIASVFGLIASVMTVGTGDGSARLVAKKQPMKFAAMEGMKSGQKGASLTTLGFVINSENPDDTIPGKDVVYKIEIPNMLSYMAYLNWDAYVPGVKDLIDGNPEQGLPSAKEKIASGKIAIQALADFKEAKKNGNDSLAEASRALLEEHYKYFGYGYFENNEHRLIPNIPITFYSFRIMVGLGFLFILMFFMVLVWTMRDKMEKKKFWLRLAVITIPFAYLASMCGWVLAEVGRQPWVIQDLMPTMIGVTRIDSGAVQTTFWLFVVIFTSLLIAEISIMTKQIKIGPKEEGGN
ncbi:MAG: cytochrome ubiquinol oxidase subunit I [Bacteroidales bacterium]